VRIGWAIAVTLILTGCQSSQQQAENAAAARARIDAAHDAKCQSYGAKPGTDAYVNCRVQLAEQQAQSDRELMAIGAGAMNMPTP
jgi:hypothetical protein